MSVSRRFETRFKIFAQKTHVTNTNNYKRMPGLISLTAASNISRANIGVPSSGNAYLIQYNSASGWWYFVAQNLGSAQNGMSVYPSTSPNWEDPNWGRTPCVINWYDGNSTSVMTVGNSFKVDSRVIGLYRYTMCIAFHHQINVVNNSSAAATFYVRSFNNYTFATDGNVGVTNLTAWSAIVIGSGATTKVVGFGPLEMEFRGSGLGGADYSVTDQRGSTRRIKSSSPALSLSTRNNSLVITEVSGGLLTEDDGPVVIDDYMTITEGYKPIYADVGSNVDNPLYATIGGSGVSNKPLYEAIVEEEVEPEPPGQEPGQPGYIDGFAYITISWNGAGYSDLDCCAYWTEKSDQKVGWSYGAGNINQPYKALWQGDDTGNGPEYIQLGVGANIAAGVIQRKYKIHLNFYGSGTGTATANVSVTFGGVTKNLTIYPSINTGTAATTSSPAVTITFNVNGIPLSII